MTPIQALIYIQVPKAATKGGEWEPIKNLLKNFAYVPNTNQNISPIAIKVTIVITRQLDLTTMLGESNDQKEAKTNHKKPLGNSQNDSFRAGCRGFTLLAQRFHAQSVDGPPSKGKGSALYVF